MVAFTSMRPLQKKGVPTVVAWDVPCNGLTAKIHALVAAEGRPIDLVMTAGQCHDGKPSAVMLETLAVQANDSLRDAKSCCGAGAWANPA
ncbi:hypothetical protein NKH82_25615 [Mesorhizobium sp. M0915]|uniref:hypothetical protein n=1 Tax=Mesorhizobium sp. M0915 TaxID=2957027 RepID=UPI00333A48CE